MRGIGRRALLAAWALACCAAIAACDEVSGDVPSTHASTSVASASPSESLSVAPTSAAEALARIDLGSLAGAFTSFLYDLPGEMPAMTSGDGQLSVNDTIFDQKVADGTFSVWGADPDHACIEYVTSAVTLYALHPDTTIATGPCPADFRDAGKLKPPRASQPGTYRAFNIAPVKGPCFYESTAELPGTGETDAWVVVSCKGSDWNWKVVGGRFATEAEHDAGFDDAFGEKLCRHAWDLAEKDGAQKLYWSSPNEINWSHGQRGVLCTAKWKKH